MSDQHSSAPETESPATSYESGENNNNLNDEAGGDDDADQTKKPSSSSYPQFVDWVPETELNALKKPAQRLYHKKSRMGCLHCRGRKVKCDEVHPICGSCTRHRAACVWDRTEGASKARGFEIRPKNSSSPEASSVNQDSSITAESKDRRLLELQLLHQYNTSSSLTINVQTDPNRNLWAQAVPRVAFTNNGLLYSIYTVAALHLAHLDRKNPDHVATYQRYLNLTLQEHRRDVSNLGPLTADAALLTSTMLRICNFALLQERARDPYAPPTEWLRMSTTIGQGLSVSAWKYIHDDPTSVMRTLINNAPGTNPDPRGRLRDDVVLFRESNREDLTHLLRRTPADVESEPWDEGVRRAYESTLSYLGSVGIAIRAGEMPDMVFRRLVLFPMMVEGDFVTLLEEGRRRALVVLAHYFAMLARFRRLWWIDDTGLKEVRGIEGVVGEEWRELMERPLRDVEDEYRLEYL